MMINVNHHQWWYKNKLKKLLKKYLKLIALIGVVVCWSYSDLVASSKEKGINNLDYLIEGKKWVL